MSRSFRQYRLRTLLLFCTLAAICLGLVRWRVSYSQRQHQLANLIVEKNGSVHWQNWGPDWLNTLLGSYYFRSIQAVNWNDCTIGDEDLNLLRELASLEELQLSGTRITDQGLNVLRRLPYIRELSLEDTHISNDGLEWVGRLRCLEVLDIRRTEINESGLVHLRGHPHLKTLKHYQPFSKRGIYEFSDVGIGHLQTIPKLQMEELRGANLSTASIRWIRSRMTGNDLTLIEPEGTAWADILLDHPTIKRLHVFRAHMRDEQLRQILAEDRLSSLSLIDVPVGDAGLVEPQKTSRLRELMLSGTRVTNAGIVGLHGPNARELSMIEDPTILHRVSFVLSSGMRGPRISWDGRFRQDDWGLLSNCRRLQVISVSAEKPGAIYYDFDGREVVREAGNSHFQVNDAALQTMASLPELMELKLSGKHKVTPEGMAILIGAPQLWSLKLESAGITNEHLRMVALLRPLSKLSLQDNPITDGGVAELAQLENLEALNLSNCLHLSNETLKTVATFRKLTRLDAQNVPFGDRGMKYLYNMPRLRELWISGSNTTGKGRHDLRNALPNQTLIMP